MQSGDYNQPFELVKVEVVTDELGDQYKQETVVYHGFAKVLNLSGREYWEAFSVHQENTLKFQTRWHPKLKNLNTKTHWLRWQGKLLDIVAVDNVAHGNTLCQIKAKAVDE